MDGIMTYKIRKYIKHLMKKHQKHTMEEAYKLISKQIKMDEALREDEMEGVKEDIRARLRENWPFERVI
jgi:hypothetical protein